MAQTKYSMFTGTVNKKEEPTTPSVSKTGRKLFQGTLEAPKNVKPATYDIPKVEQPKKSTIFSVPKALDDGFQFKDIFTITASTVGDVLVDAVHGVASIGEGIVDAGRYGISAIARKTGNTELANHMVDLAKQDTMGMIFNPADKYFDKGSILGDKVDSVVQSIGYMGGIYATAGLGASGASAAGLGTTGVQAAATAVSTGATFTAAFGNSASEAYNEGATDSQAMRYGLISGLGEAGTNLLFGGMGQLIPGVGLSTGVTNIDDVIAKKVSNIFQKQWQKNLAQYTIKSSAEGFEEVLAGLIQATGQYITYKTKEEGYTWGQLVQDQNLLEQFISGAVVSAIAQAPGLIHSNRAGKDFVTNLTADEEAEVVKQSVDEISKKEKELGRPLTDKEKNEIRRNVTDDIDTKFSLSDALEASGITSETISKITDIDTANQAVSELLTMYTSFVPVKKLDAHINSPVYTLLIEAEAKRNALMDQKSELENIDRANELQNKIVEAEPNTVESIVVANEINAINKKLDKNNAIPVMQNRTFEAKYDMELLDQARKLLDDYGFEGDVITTPTAEQMRIADIGAAFGKKVVFLTGADVAGVVMPDDSSILFINETVSSGLLVKGNNKNKMLYALGHELYHSMKMTDPETYNQFIDYVKSVVTSEQITKFMTMYDSADTDAFYSRLQINGEYNIPELLAHPDKYPRQTKALDRIVEEMIANEFGGMITDVEYMTNLKTKDKTLFDKVVKMIRDFFDALSKPIYKTSLTQIQVSEIRNKFESVLSEVKAMETEKVNTSQKQVTSPAKEVAKVTDTNVTNVTNVTKKPAKNVEKVAEKVQKNVMTPELLETVRTKRDVIHSTDNDKIIDLMTNGVTGKEMSIAIQNKGTKPVKYNNGTFTIYFKPELLNETNAAKNFDGDGATNLAHRKESDRKFNTLADLINDDTKIGANNKSAHTAYNEMNVVMGTKLADYVDHIDASPRASKENIEALRKMGIKVNEPKQPTLTKPKETKEVKETKPTLPTKPEDIGKETKTIAMDMDAWYARINDMLVNANKLTGTKHRDALKSVTHAYNNYKAKGGTKTIDALEDTNKLDFKDKLLSKMDVRKLPNTDSDGNKLSKEQQEYFKDSKVRDENGNLLTVYHGTDNFGFTKFDAKFNNMMKAYSGQDTVVAFFTENENIAKTYTENQDSVYKCYLNIKNPLVVDTNFNGWEDIPASSNEFGATTTDDIVLEAIKSKKYDGVIFKNISDYGPYDVPGLDDYSDNYVVFNSNQIKNVDNLTPTKNDDIRYLPTATSKLSENIHENGLFSDLVDYVKTHPELIQYETTSHKQDYAKAVAMIENDAVGTIEQFMSKTSEQLISVDTQIGKLLMKVYQKHGDVANEVAIYNKLQSGGTTHGQFVESLKVLREMSPAGVVLRIQNDLDRAYQEMQNSTDKTLRDWVTANASKAQLTDAERKWIYSMADSVKNLDPESRKYQVTYALINEFIADRIPKSFTNKLKTFRRLAMLFNPKTQVRNIGGNAIMLPINAVVDKVASFADKQLSKKTNVRTTDAMNFKEGKKSFARAITEVTEDAKLGITTRSVGDAYDLPRGKTFNDSTKVGKTLNWVEKVTNYMLEAGDRGFEQLYYDMSLNNQMKLAGVSEPTELMKQIAQEEASKRTWKNNSKMVQVAGSARETLNKIHIGELGMGDIILPFIMTPANLAVATYEYSPAVGISIFKNANKYNAAVKAGNATEIALAQKQLVDSIGKGTVGTLIYALAYGLAKAGKITGDEDEDKDIRNLMKAQGFQPFSVQIGDKSYTYDWAQPLSSPFAIMAELERTTKLTGEKQNILEATLKAFSIGGTRLYEQSFLSSLKTLFSGDDMFEGIIDTAMSVPASFVPTLFSQIANLMDSSTKVTYDSESPLKTMIYKAAVKVPGVKSLLPSKYNVLGKQMEIYNGKNNIFNVMLNPGNVSGDTVGDLGAELMDVYNHTGENSVIPQVASTYVDYTIDGVKHRATFSTAQQSELQQAMGKIATDALNEMMISDIYNSATYEQKATALTSLMQYARAKAIEDSGFAKGYSIKSGNASQVKKYVDSGLSISNAVMYDGIINAYKSLKDEYGETIKGSENGQKAHAIVNMPITEEQKNIMLQLISPTAKNPETVDSLGNLQTQQEFIDYYSLSRSDYMVTNNYSRDDYDIATNYYNFNSRDFIKYTNNMANIKSDYDANGKSISGSKKKKVVNYINGLPISSMQKVYLYAQAGYSVKAYKNQIYSYINGLNISASEKQTIWKSFGF